ncbi:MAG: CapA family protein [Defluviitaleaceae bacterium]|nr:CapA family protein [Defluviitaleaceae bacterium]
MKSSWPMAIFLMFAFLAVLGGAVFVVEARFGDGDSQLLALFQRVPERPVFAAEQDYISPTPPADYNPSGSLFVYTGNDYPSIAEATAIEYYQPTQIEATPTPSPSPSPHEPPTPDIVTLTLSAAGDVTLGGDSRWAGYHAFMREFANSGNDHSHFFRNIAHVFRDSDLSIVNLEGTLTYATYHMDKQFVFRGPPHFARILSSSYVDVVTIANNHTIDFFDRGYNDTRAALTAEGIRYFGNEFNTIMEINGILVGMFGYRVWDDSANNRNRIQASIDYLQNSGAQLIIAYFHWGVERNNHPEQYQRNIGRFAIRQGVDLVLGAHPHVIQGIEQYMGRHIVYSLANFSFGGNANPPCQDSFIFQQTFSFQDGQLRPYDDTYIIPVFVSSVRGRNDFTPTIATGTDGERILGRIAEYSYLLNN